MFSGRSEKLPPEFGKILGARSWPALSEVHLATSSAGWAWVRFHVQKSLKVHRVGLMEPCRCRCHICEGDAK